MIARYTRPEMGEVWSDQNKFDKMKEVEIAVAKVQAGLGLIPAAAAKAIASKADFSVDRILEIEKTTKHDVIAFVSAMAEKVGQHGRYIHFGLTSSDVLDTALSLQVIEAGKLIEKSLNRFEKSLKKQMTKHEKTLCAGRTHGMHAEPTSFGLKLAGFYKESQRNSERFQQAIKQASICKLSGAVGTYSMQTDKVEKGVAKALKLKPESVATQVIPRDRHAELIFSLAMIGSGLERLAVELRHLQRTEVYEVLEGFSKGQKGSSAMPHKKNPISSENITGVARLLRSYAQAAMENIPLWHERDISHSSVERVIFPDAFILAHYALERMADVVDNLQVDQERMWENMQQSKGQLFSSHVLLALVDLGYSREEAYVKVQGLSHGLKNGETLKDKLLQDSEVGSQLSKKRVDDIFSGKLHQKAISKVLKRATAASKRH